MKKLALIPCLLLVLSGANAQDMIISIKHDTILCSIISVSDERILYELKNSDGSITGRQIPVSEVLEYSRSKVPWGNKPEEVRTPDSAYPPDDPWCLGLNAGVSALPWFIESFELSSARIDYYDRLKTGFHINGEAYYMLRRSFGLGVEYSFFMTGTSGSVPVEYLFIPPFFSMLSERTRVFVNYPGISVLMRQHLDNQGEFFLSESLSAGLLFFRMETQRTHPNVSESGYRDVTTNSLLTGNSFCGKLGLDLEYKPTGSISFGLGGGFMWSSMKRASMESRGENNYSVENEKLARAMKLSRIDLSLVVRYYF